MLDLVIAFHGPPIPATPADVKNHVHAAAGGDGRLAVAEIGLDGFHAQGSERSAGAATQRPDARHHGRQLFDEIEAEETPAPVTNAFTTKATRPWSCGYAVEFGDWSQFLVRPGTEKVGGLSSLL